MKNECLYSSDLADFNKTCIPTLDHFKLVTVLAQVWVPDGAGLFKFRSYERNVGYTSLFLRTIV